MYKRHRVKILKTKGVSIKKIARILGISKNTVKKYLKDTQPPQFKTRKYEKKLDEYEQEIHEMAEKNCIGTRIYNELVKKGYHGSLSSVHRYLQSVKRNEEINKLSTTRVETRPGQQMQYDWKEWFLTVGGEQVKIYLHEVVLSYSRKKYCAFSLSITVHDIIRVLVEAIHFFGGTPGEFVIDNAKQMVITHSKDGIVRYNEDFLKFCGLYGIEPAPCKNYRARTKGKAERPFYRLDPLILDN